MDLRPVQPIRPVTPVNLNRAAEDLTPPFPLDGTVPMEDDSYNSSASEHDRGMEQDEPEEPDEEETTAISPPETSPKKVNFFA